MAKLTVAAGAARGLMELAIARGASRDALAERSGINPADLEDQDGRIPLAKYMALMKAGQDLCDDPALALHYAETVDMSEFSVVGLLTHACETMLEAFVQLNRYGRLVVEMDLGTADRFQLVQRDGKLWLVDRRPDPNSFPEHSEAAFARLACGPRRFDQTPFVEAVHFTHADRGYRAEYERIFRAPITFESDWNAMQIDAGWLTHRVAQQPRYAFGILSKHADALLDDLESSKSMRGRVEGLLMPILHTGQANIGTIARQLEMSRQTLYRRLKAEGVTFATVLDELRRRLALEYLQGRKVSVNEIAYLVGFADPTAFSRAFKRWTGSSPRAIRSSGHRGGSAA